jgi:uncharacterized surface protein with fasciclin (FAS1) repeats
MRKIAAGVAAASALALVATGMGPAAAADMGTKSLAEVLTADDGGFDKNNKDFDIVTAAVLAVLEAKPESAVSVLADGSVALTAFVPNDKAFKILARQVTGKKIKTEKKAFTEIAGLGIDTVETVLLYHVVPGATITAKQARASDGAKLETALGETVKVKIRGANSKQIRLSDKDTNSRNARVNVPNVNKGNMQIAHGVDRVLRPLDLPPTANH